MTRSKVGDVGFGPESLVMELFSKRPSCVVTQYKDHGLTKDNKFVDMNQSEVLVKQVVGQSWKCKARGNLESVCPKTCVIGKGTDSRLNVDYGRALKRDRVLSIEKDEGLS